MTISCWLNFGRPAPPGRGSAARRKFLAPPYYSRRAVFASLWVLFWLLLLQTATINDSDSQMTARWRRLTKRQKTLSIRRTRVPTTQARRLLVLEEHYSHKRYAWLPFKLAVSQCHISVTNRTKINIKSRTALSRVHTAAKAAYVAKLSVLPVISRWTWVSQYRNVSILDFIGAKGDGDGEWWQLELWDVQAPVRISPPTNQHPVFFYMLDALPVDQPKASKHWRERLLLFNKFQITHPSMHSMAVPPPPHLNVTLELP